MLAVLLGCAASGARAAPSPAGPGDAGVQTFVGLAPGSADLTGVNVANGDFFLSSNIGAKAYPSDDADAEAALSLSYNSETPDRHWNLTEGPDVAIRQVSGGVELTGPSGFDLVFNQQSDGTFSSPDSNWSLTQNSDGTYTADDHVGNTYSFDSGGTLTAVTDSGTGVTTGIHDTSPSGPGPEAITPVKGTDPAHLSSLTSSLNSTEGLTMQWGTVGSTGADDYTGVVTGSGVTDTFQYAAQDRITSETFHQTSGDAGSTTQFGYNAQGLMSTISEPNGNAENVDYNSSGQVTSIAVTRSSGSSSTYSYDYEAPDPKICQSDDIGETVVTSAGSVPPITYCYNGSGIVDASNDGSVLWAGQKLTSGNSLVAGSYSATMQSDGDFVLSGPAGSWDTGTGGNPGAYLTLQPDGNIAVIGAGGNTLWQTNTTDSTRPELTLTGDGVLGLYDTSNNVVWETFAGQDVDPINMPASASTSSSGASPNAEIEDGVVCKPKVDWPHYSYHADALPQRRRVVNAEASLRCFTVEDGVETGAGVPGSENYDFQLLYAGNTVKSKSVELPGKARTEESVQKEPCRTGLWQSIVKFTVEAPLGFDPPLFVTRTVNGTVVHITACRKGVNPIPVS